MVDFAQKLLGSVQNFEISQLRPNVVDRWQSQEGQLILPLFALLSIAVFLLNTIVSYTLSKLRSVDAGDTGWIKGKSREWNAKSILPFKVARLLCSLGLLALSIYYLVSNKEHTHAILISLVCFYGYTSILSIFSLTAHTQYWRVISTRHVASLQIVAFIFYATQSLKPYVTLGHIVGRDVADEKLGWVRLTLQAIAGALIPLFAPHPFIALTPEHTPNPEATASYISLLTFSFLDRIIWKAYRVPHLDLEQLPPLQEKDSSAILTAQAFPLLDPTLNLKGKQSHIFWRCTKWLRKSYALMALYQGAQTLAQFIAPISLKMLLGYLEEPYTSGAKPWVWVLLIAFGPITSSLLEQRYLVHASRVMTHFEAVFTQLVFEHSLRIRLHAPPLKSDGEDGKEGDSSPAANIESLDQTISEAVAEVEVEAAAAAKTSLISDSTEVAKGEVSSEASTAIAKAEADDQKAGKSLVGVMTNLVTTDLGLLRMPVAYLFDIPFCIVQVILSVAFLWQVLGWSALLGVLTMVITLPVPTLLSKLLLTTQRKKMERTDERVELVTQNINVMRMIKLFAWEPKVKSQISDRREKELKLIRRGRILDISTSIVQSLLPLSTMVVTYATYTMVMKQDLTASVVFSSMAVFNMLKQNIHRTFWAIPMLLRSKVSLDRFNDFFNKTELLDASRSNDMNNISPDAGTEIKFNPSSHTWTRDGNHPGLYGQQDHRFVLQIEKELTFQQGVINLILGPTASGKTSILMALLGEMYSRSSDEETAAPPYQLPRANGIAYAAQESWVLNDTIKNNIVFGEVFDEERYSTVLEQCALRPDISRFEAGDMTEVGEKGLTLSGGQKARITLARAVYSKAQTLLLDDVLSALDVHTAKWIVDKCFRGTLISGRTVLLVTHNVALVAPVSGFAIELDPNGQVVRQGSLDTLLLESSVLQAEAQHDQENLQSSKEAAETKDDTPPDDSSKGKLIISEEIALGRVSWPAIKLYVFGYGGWFFWIFSLGGYTLSFGLDAFAVWFLGYWASQYEVHESGSVPVARFLGFYVLISCIAYVLQAFSAISFVFGASQAARRMHTMLINSIFQAPLRWLDTIPLARIISRCTADTEAIDDALPNWMESLLQILISLVVALVAVVYVAGWRAVILGLLIVFAGAGWGSIYLRAQLCVKRENSNAKSPVLSHFHTAIGGIVSIRAYGVQDAFKAKSRTNIDKYTRSLVVLWDLNRWIGVRTDCLGGLFSGIVGAYLVYGSHAIAAGDTGFALNQMLNFSSILLVLVRVYNMFEVQANSAERIKDFLVIDQEPLSTEQGKPPAYWPSSGNIIADGLSAQYSKDGPLVLRDLSFDIKSGERIGIVGRTGAGKSTFALALLRAIPTTGQVVYDNQDVAKLNLEALRSSITLIPQQPELLAGTVRDNLDLFSEHEDATLNDALRSAGLYTLSASRGESSTDLTEASVSNDRGSVTSKIGSKVTLDTRVEAGGANFSLGQRQILALARALVRRSKVLLLDEATASIDHDTDAIIQRTIRTELSKDTTVITVAHRLQTIMDSDRIMVLEAGRLVEFDKPAILLQKEGGIFRSMVDESRDRETLRSVAGL